MDMGLQRRYIHGVKRRLQANDSIFPHSRRAPNACYLAFCKVKCLLLIFYNLSKENALRVYIVRLR